MKYDIIITNNAEDNLIDIAYYIAQDNPKRAESFINEIKSFFEKNLELMPLAFAKVRRDIRMLPYKRYSIFYTINEKEKIVSILHIFAGGRDWDILI